MSKFDTKEVHYVVVVHGIGEQRPNETVPAVISRFAEARKLDWHEYKGISKEVPLHDFISMGKVASQAGTKTENGKVSFAGEHPWSQFEGIPSSYGKPIGNFNAIRSDGEANVRFVDMYWADILNDYYAVSGQSVQAWTDGVLGRLNNSGEYSGKEKVHRAWIMRVLTQVQETALFATKVAGLPGVNATDELNDIMDKFVGDIQIYGENRSVRGAAVARFHGLMEKIHEQHLQEYEIYNYSATEQHVNARYKVSPEVEKRIGATHVRPKIHVIAHSLGTVMSMDAILYGHVRKAAAYSDENKSQTQGFRNLPFEMYGEDQLKKVPWNIEKNCPEVKDPKDIQPEELVHRTDGDFIGSNWIDNLESYVTLGSPIDKYLVLFPENYRYLDGEPYTGFNTNFNKENLDDCIAAARQVFAERNGGDFPKIRHYNYCDEQDPVGHHLNLFSDTGAYHLLFDHKGERDVVYNKYKIPGVAHVMYWEDQELMRRILHQTVDGDVGTRKAEDATTHHTPNGDDFMLEQSPAKNYWVVMLYTYYLPALVAGLAMGGIFYWGWSYLIETPEDLTWPAVAAIAFSLAGYLFRKIISLLVWWRQALRTKANDSKSSSEQMVLYHSVKSSKVFKFTMWLGCFALGILSLATVAATINNSPVLKESVGVSQVGIFFGMLVAAGIVVYIYGQSGWSRSYGKKATASKVPEWITVGVMALITGLVFLMPILFSSDQIASWSRCVPDNKIGMVAIFTGGLTIAWIYVTAAMYAVKFELKGQEGAILLTLAAAERKLSKFIQKYLFIGLLIIAGIAALASLVMCIIGKCWFC